MIKSFLLALQFLTVIPINHSFVANDKQLGLSVLFYPAIGLAMGGVLVLLASIFSGTALFVQAGIILTCWVLLTGGLHLDGLADCADAWVGGLGNRARSLEIMKDPAAGPIAVIVLVLVLLLKWATIISVLEKQDLLILLLTPMLGRLAIILLMLSTRYIRVGGLGEKIVANFPRLESKVVGFIGLVVAVYYLGFLPVGLMLIFILIVGYQANKRLGGVTGDVYGSVVELAEVSVLLGYSL